MISYAQIAHINSIRTLWKETFHDSDKFLDLYFEKLFKPEQCVVSIENGELCAAMQVLPYHFQVDASMYKAAYIFAVMTNPNKRNRGHMSRMFDFIFQELPKQAVDFTFLIPQNEELAVMYQKLGFLKAFVQEKHQLILPISDCAVHIPLLATAYEFYLETIKGINTVVHSQSQFEFLVQSLREEGGELLAYSEEGKLSALCFALPTTEGLRVLDLYSNSEVATNALLAGLRNTYSSTKAIVSSSSLSNKSTLGMVKPFKNNTIDLATLQNVYLSLMMNE